MPSKSTIFDAHGQPMNRAFNAALNYTKSIESLIGIVRGVLADNSLHPDEVLFLDTWLRDNQELTLEWPGDVLAARIQSVLADGFVSQEELTDLKTMLAGLIGGTMASSGSAGGEATRLPVDHCTEIEVPGKTFCFTGKFICGSRKHCQQQITDRGGEAVDTITWKLNYLVIGALASRDWAHTSYGRKIEAAVQAKRKGASIVILAEERWQQLLPAAGSGVFVNLD